jgi:hypothetical protein
MAKIRQALSGGKRGDQARLGHMRCVNVRTASTWKAIADVLEVADGIVSISRVEHFQPSHAAEIARAYRPYKRNGPDGMRLGSGCKDKITRLFDVR